MFLAYDTIPRFLSFCMDICGGGENLFLCSLGEWTYSYRAVLPMSPALPFIGGTPCPAAACPLPADRHKKNTPARPSSSTARPRFPPAVDPARLHMLRTVPRRAVPPAAALLLATVSLNTYLANNKFTSYRSFAAASGCSASILYPHRSQLRL